MKGANPHRWTGLAVPVALVLGAACADPSVAPEVAGPPTFHATVDSMPVSLSGSGTAVVDGIMTPGEWAAADSLTFAAALPVADSLGPSTPATLYVMNDDSMLYVALRLRRPAFSGATNFFVEFDNDHDGARADGDDVIGMVVGDSFPVEFVDVYRLTCEGAPPNSAGCSARDPSVDGMAGAAVNGDYTVFEMAHPLRSGDAGHDFNLSSGQTVGFDVMLGLFAFVPDCFDWTVCTADTFFPAASLTGYDFGDIRISGGGGDSTGTTTLTVQKTATGFGENLIQYAWWVGKQASPPGDTVLPGQTVPVSYTVAVVRWPTSTTLQYGARGQFCVTNTGAAPTDSLILLDQVQYRLPGDSAFQNVPETFLSGFPGHAVIGAGATECYDYEVRFAGISGAEYRNVGQALIANYAGHAGESFGPQTIVGFTIPDTLPVVIRNSAVTLTEQTNCPAGFTCTLSGSGPWYVAGDDTLRFTAQIRNDSAPCGLMVTVTDSVLLTTSQGSYVSGSGVAWVSLYTGDCPGGCTRSQGFWKTHIDEVAPRLPIWLGLSSDSAGSPDSRSVLVASGSQAFAILGMTGGSPSNGIIKLYAQLLAAKLNIAAGASPAAVADVLWAADAFLQYHDATSWSVLSSIRRETVLNWVAVLERYNSGVIGPGPCQ